REPGVPPAGRNRIVVGREGVSVFHRRVESPEAEALVVAAAGLSFAALCESLDDDPGRLAARWSCNSGSGYAYCCPEARMKAIQLQGFEGTASLEIVEVERPSPGPDELLLEVKAAGLNWAEVEQTRGRYPVARPLPAVMGFEAAGVVVGL